MNSTCRLFIILVFLVLNSTTVLFAQEKQAIPGEFLVEPPTLICAGFEWEMSGDDNHNATVALFYREKGERSWREALPMLRLFGERTNYPRLNLDYVAPNMFAGSIFDLKPGTSYECKAKISDPDGVQGENTKIATFTTRPEPQVYKGGRTFHVYPPGFKGEKEEPAYPDLLRAYYGAGQGYWGGPQVQPGDIILVHAGMYRGDYENYSSHLNLDFYGRYVFSQDGTVEKPIVIKAAGDGPVVFDGDGCHCLFDVSAADYTYIEGLTLINADVGIYAGRRHVHGCDGLVVRNCVLENVGVGIMAQYIGSQNFYIADNIILGRDNRHRLHGWTGHWMEYGIPSKVNSFIGIDINGQGHAVCFNYVAYFHDGIDITQQGPPVSRDMDKKVCSIDFYNNDIYLMADDFFEADCAVRNVRIFRNRCFNSAHSGISAQPIYGGPAYFIRNILYHVPSGGIMKFNIHPSGVLVYNNTLCGEWSWGVPYSNVHVRNNLFLGTDYPERLVLNANTYTSYTSFDYNGYRYNKNSDQQFHWKSPREAFHDYQWKQSVECSSATLEDFRAATGQEEQGVVVDYDIFHHASAPDYRRPGKIYSPDSLDFQLLPGSAAIDAGCDLLNITDNYRGSAPDLGALEAGLPAPVYGPRQKMKF